MKHEIKKLENSTVELLLSLEGKEVETAKAEAVKKLSKEVEVKGFRKGHAPLSVIETEFAGAIKETVTDTLLNAHYEAIIKENDLKPVDFLKTVEVKLVEDKFEGKFVVAVYPEFTLGEYKGLEATKEAFEMKDELVETELNALIQKSSKLEATEEGYKASTGDTVTLDFEGFVDGVAFEGGKAEGHQLSLGSKMFIDTFEDQLVGYTAGQEGEVNVTFLLNTMLKNLAGKPAMFKVKVTKIEKLIKAELNDEFAKEQGFESLEDMKTKKFEEIKTREEARVEGTYKNDLLTKLVEGTEISLPQIMVEREANNRLKEMEQQLKSQGATLDMYMQMTGQTKEAMMAQLKPMAEGKVKLDLILDAVATQEKIEVTEAEVETKMSEVAKMYGMEEKLVEELTKMKNLDNFRANLKLDVQMQKTVDFIVAEAK